MNITAKYVNDPKPGKEFGTVKGEDGTYYFVNEDHLRLFEQGKTYDCDVKVSGKEGQFKWITGIGGTPCDLLIKQGPQQAGAAVGAVAAQTRNGEAPPILSNVLAHAITVGAQPDDLPRWAAAVSRAIVAFNSGEAPEPEPEDPDDRIPF